MAELQYPFRGLKMPRRLLGMLFHTKRYMDKLHEASATLNRMCVLFANWTDAEDRLEPFRKEVEEVRTSFQDFVDGYHRLRYGINPVCYWHYIVIYWMVAGNKVQAIKEIRTRTGLGLKEAKDIADILHHKLWNVQRTDLARGVDYANVQLKDPDHYEILAALELAAEL